MGALLLSGRSVVRSGHTMSRSTLETPAKTTDYRHSTAQNESECLVPEDLWSRDRTYLVFGVQFGAERGHKTMGNSMSHCI